jgi:hypothetical protein
MNYPLFLSYTGTTIGNGFIAQIEARMKVLAERTDSHTIMWSVVPADVVALGADLDAAHARLREQLRQLFVEIATEQLSFEDFQRAVEQLGASTDESKLADWDNAVRVIRQQGDVSLLGIPVVKAEVDTYFRVTKKSAAELTPALNEPPRMEPLSGSAHVQLAAAA